MSKDIEDYVAMVVATAPPFSEETKAVIYQAFNEPRTVTEPGDLDDLREVMDGE